MIDAFGRRAGWLVLQVDGGGIDIDLTFGESLASSAVSTFLLTLIVGAILVAVVPAYVERMMDVVRADPVSSFLYGLFFFIAFAIILVALLISFVGIPAVFVLGPLIAIAWFVGVSVAFLAIADRLVDHREDGWLKPLLIAAGMNGGLAFTGIGGLLSLLVGIAGFGAVVSDALD